MKRAEIRALLEQVHCGAVEVESAADQLLQYLRQSAFEDLGFSRVDHLR